MGILKTAGLIDKWSSLNSGPGTFEKWREQFEKLREQELFQNSLLSMLRVANVKFSQKCPSSPNVGLGGASKGVATGFRLEGTDQTQGWSFL